MASVQSAAISAVTGAGPVVAAPPVAPGDGRPVLAAEAAATPAPAPTPAGSPAVTETGNAVRQAVDEAAAQIKKFLQSSPAPATLEFTVDEDSGRVLLRILDAQTKQIIRQLPPDEVLAVARAMDRFQGILLSIKA